MIRRPVSQESLRALLSPRSVAVVGASPTNEYARVPLANFTVSRFPGQVIAVNPRYEEVMGIPCFPTLRDAPFVPDAVMVVVNRDRVNRVLTDAAEVGSKGAVVLAIGFAEAGGHGVVLQRELVDIASSSDMAVLGPNCQGAINFYHPTPLYMDHVAEYEPGHVALMAQSGSVATALTNNMRGVRWSHVVSCGNEAVVDSADLLTYFIDSPEVHVICAFLEAIRDPARFFSECDRARALGKPVVVLKSGRTEAARVAAAAHSGALASPDRLVDALLRRHGVIRVDSMEELLETAIALQVSRSPRRPKVATLTASGGQIELVLDEAAEVGLLHPKLAPATVNRLEQLLPDFLSATNPLDYWGMQDLGERLPQVVEALHQDPNVDVVISVGDFTVHPTGETDRAGTSVEIATRAAGETDTLMVVLDTVDGTVPAVVAEQSVKDGFLCLSGLREGLRAVKHLVDVSQPVAPAGPSRAGVDAAHVRRLVEAMGSTPTSGLPGLQLLDAAGVTVARSEVVEGPEAALKFATEVGWPVVLKAADPALAHKTEAGAVALNLTGEDALRRAFAAVATRASGPVLCQEQVFGVELILGIQTDESLGSFVVVGLGGIWTEILDDVAISATGLRNGEAMAMLRALRGYELLSGARGQAKVDVDAVVDAIEAVDRLASTLGPEISAVDVNPLLAHENGVTAVDCLVVPASEHQQS